MEQFFVFKRALGAVKPFTSFRSWNHFGMPQECSFKSDFTRFQDTGECRERRDGGRRQNLSRALAGQGCDTETFIVTGEASGVFFSRLFL